LYIYRIQQAYSLQRLTIPGRPRPLVASLLTLPLYLASEIDRLAADALAT
jgi:hypothetical protein